MGGRGIFPSRVNVCFRLGSPDKNLSEVITGSPSRRVEIETEKGRKQINIVIEQVTALDNQSSVLQYRMHLRGARDLRYLFSSPQKSLVEGYSTEVLTPRNFQLREGQQVESHRFVS